MACKGLLRGLSESAQSAVVLQVIAGPTALHPANSVSEATTNYRLDTDAPMRESPAGVAAAAVAVPANIAAGSEGLFLPLVRR
ncbi:hypothetical protein [Candidatus Chloroploca sp. Khr17]|uniref:hypothetical protein n=1 Tax=Candidatus Chloroploca sp. Khr17 TaxID=2496869 RepID=UPI00101B8F43|nr:hypothetical protein [Candidatus Chloroploca sp. Khr17]